MKLMKTERVLAVALCLLLSVFFMGAIVQSSKDAGSLLTIDPTSKAARATLYRSASEEVSPSFFASFSNVTGGGTIAPPAWTVCMFGSVAKVIKVRSIIVNPSQSTTPGISAFFIDRTVPSGQLESTQHLIRHDTHSAGSAVFSIHVPTSGLTPTNNLRLRLDRIVFPILTSVVRPSYDMLKDLHKYGAKPITLRAHDEVLCVGYQSGAGTLQNVRVNLEWTENDKEGY